MDGRVDERRYLIKAAALMADAKSDLVNEAGRDLMRRMDRTALDPSEWPKDEELAALRELLKNELRIIRMAELNNARDAPLPPEYAPVSEAYFRQLSDDLDNPEGK